MAIVPLQQPLLLLLLLPAATVVSGCIEREMEYGIVCVCNGRSCDSIEPHDRVFTPRTADAYRTSYDGARMHKTRVRQTREPAGHVLELDASTAYQRVLGFGGAFTESTGAQLLSLPKATRERLMQQYFGPHGAEYTLGRVPIAATDYSFRMYSYDDISNGTDFRLEQFDLAAEDYIYKLPFIKQAARMQAHNGGLRLVASPWICPYWMNTNGACSYNACNSSLLGDESGPYYDVFARYLVKFVEAYHAERVPIWGLSIQNEPISHNQLFPTARHSSNFIKNHLHAAMSVSDASQGVKLLGLDDNRNYVEQWIDEFASDEAALALLDGIAVHFYQDNATPASILNDTHHKHPDKLILYTEGTNNIHFDNYFGVKLGDYARGENYARNILRNLNNWAVGFIEWNLALDTEGGHSVIGNVLDASIIVDAAKGEFYKQPSYYAMAHFSKFLKPGAQVVKLAAATKADELPDGVEAIGAVMVDGNRYTTIVNESDSQNVTISLKEKNVDGAYTTVFIPARSITTVIWPRTSHNGPASDA